MYSYCGKVSKESRWVVSEYETRIERRVIRE
jgi:hypothetical protein